MALNSRPNEDRNTPAFDPLPAPDLGRLAQLESAVNAHLTGGHDVLALSAAICNSGELQQLA